MAENLSKEQRVEYLKEAYRRGVLPEEQTQAFEEAVRRGLIDFPTDLSPQQEQPPQSQGSTAAGLIAKPLEGLTAGFAGELVGAVNAPIDTAAQNIAALFDSDVQPRSLSENYRRRRLQIENSLKRAEKEQPIAATGLDFGGALLGAGKALKAFEKVAPKLSKAFEIQKAKKGASGLEKGLRFTGRAGRVPAAAAIQGGVEGVGRADTAENIGEQARTTAITAGALGGALTAASPVIKGGAKFFKNIGEAIGDVATNKTPRQRSLESLRKILSDEELNEIRDIIFSTARETGGLAGVDSFPIAAASDKGIIRGLSRTLAQSSATRDKATPAIENLRKATKELQEISVKNLPPPIASSFEGAESLVTAGKKIIDTRTAIRKELAKPYYKTAYSNQLTQDQVDNLLQNPSLAEYYDKALKNSSIQTDLQRELPANVNKNTSLKLFDEIKKDIDDDMSKAGINQARRLKKTKEELVSVLDEISPEYATARGISAEGFEGIEQIIGKKGARTELGKILDFQGEDVLKQVRNKFDTSDPTILRKMRQTFKEEGEEKAFQQGVKGYILNKFDKRKIKEPRALYNALFATREQEERMIALMGEESAKGLKKVTETVDKIQNAINDFNFGSDSVTKAETLEFLREESKTGGARLTSLVRGKLRAVKNNFGLTDRETLDLVESMQDPSFNRALADILFSPKGRLELQNIMNATTTKQKNKRAIEFLKSVDLRPAAAANISGQSVDQFEPQNN